MLIFPPAFSILDKACFETKCADISIFFLISPVPNIFNLMNFLFTNFFSFKILRSKVFLILFQEIAG